MTKPIIVKNLEIGSGMPKVCVPITAQEEAQICEQARAAVAAGADLVEWRADFFGELENPAALKKALAALADILGQIPLIFTIRTSEEGGNRQIALDSYVNLNLAAARTQKTDFIDVQVFGNEEEKRRLVTEIQAAGVRVIASSHDFEKTDDKETLLKRFQQMATFGPDILKMAVMPHEFGDVAALMQATDTMRREYTDKPLVSMAMGSEGAISRIAGENFGSSITFGTAGPASAPGQAPVRELRMMMEALHQKNIQQ